MNFTKSLNKSSFWRGGVSWTYLKTRACRRRIFGVGGHMRSASLLLQIIDRSWIHSVFFWLPELSHIRLLIKRCSFTTDDRCSPFRNATPRSSVYRQAVWVVTFTRQIRYPWTYVGDEEIRYVPGAKRKTGWPNYLHTQSLCSNTVFCRRNLPTTCVTQESRDNKKRRLTKCE